MAIPRQTYGWLLIMQYMTAILKTMPDLTEEEYAALDKKWTENPPKPGPNETGFFAQRKAALTAQSARSITVDAFTADYLVNKAIAARKTPADIIGEMVQKEIAGVL